MRLGFDSEECIVIDSGSDSNLVHPSTRIRVEDETTMREGLRFCRGMNLALAHWLQEHQTEWIFLLPVDYEVVRFELQPLQSLFLDYPQIALVAPIQVGSEHEALVGSRDFLPTWQFDDGPLLLSRSVWKNIPRHVSANFEFFNDANFRSVYYSLEAALRVLYLGFGVGITSFIATEENEDYLKEFADSLKTDANHLNLDLAREESSLWLSNQFGSSDHWYLVRLVEALFRQFMSEEPEIALLQNPLLT